MVKLFLNLRFFGKMFPCSCGTFRNVSLFLKCLENVKKVLHPNFQQCFQKFYIILLGFSCVVLSKIFITDKVVKNIVFTII